MLKPELSIFASIVIALGVFPSQRVYHFKLKFVKKNPDLYNVITTIFQNLADPVCSLI